MLFESISSAAEAESPVWAASLRAVPDPEPVFSPLVPETLQLGLETIYEAYLVHFGRPRLFAPADGDTALLLGDYLYAHGLVRISALGDTAAVSDLAEDVHNHRIPRTGHRFILESSSMQDVGTVTFFLYFEDAQRADTERYGALFRHLLSRGIYVAPSQFECMFGSLAHADEEIDRTVEEIRGFLAA